jgi:hypothetical protein
MPHNEFIARLRGVAVLMAVLMHYTFCFPISYASPWFAGNGYYGVVMIFTISGFLITTYLRRKYGYAGIARVFSIPLNSWIRSRLSNDAPDAVTDAGRRRDRAGLTAAVVRRRADIVAARLDVAAAGPAADWSGL